jgi:hypothetical protein
MLALGLLLNTVGIGVFCWLIFTLAVHALPFFVAVNAGIWAFHGDAGVLGTPLVAVAAGGMSLAIAQIAFAMRAIVAAGVCFAGYFCWLSRRSRNGANRRAVARLAGGLRMRRCGPYRRHSVDAFGRLGAPTSRTGQGGRRQSSTSSRGRHARGMISLPSSSNRFAQIGARGVRGLTERTPLSSPSASTGWSESQSHSA